MSNNNIETIGKKSTQKNKRLATDYASSSGLKNTVNFKDGKVYVGGKEMKDYHIDGDSKAHVDKDEMDNAISELKDSIGIEENKYDEKISNAVEDIENTEDWSYNPEEDPAYRAYREMYHREGQRAYEDAFGQMAALTGGYESSAAVTAGAQQLNYYNSQLNDKLGELAEKSYERYADDIDNKHKYLSGLLDLDEAQTEKNKMLYDRFNEATDADIDRTIYEAYTRRMNANELERDKYDTENYEYYRSLEGEEQLADIMSKRAETAYKNAYNRGYFTAEEAQILGIEPNANGAYPSPFAAEVQRELDLWNTVGKAEVDYETQAAIRKALATKKR